MQLFSILALAASISSVAAFSCGTGTPTLQPYCCSSTSLTPRGYVGSQCANASIVSDSSDDSDDSNSDPDSDNNTPVDFNCEDSSLTFICCQKLEVLGNGVPTAYYCGQPQSGTT